MQQRLLAYYNDQMDAFRENFIKVREDFGFNAIHDMRVAIKRLRAVIILAKKLDPNLKGKRAEGDLRHLFRLSGRMRDAQVQQALLKEYETVLNVGFGEYAAYLLKLEQKSIQKFKAYLQPHSATDFTADLELTLPALILKSDKELIKSATSSLIEQLFQRVDDLKADQESDESLHEIRRQLKQISYLLSVFDKEDPDFSELKKKLKMLEKANQLLGRWHDHAVAEEYLCRFLKNKDTGDSGIYNLYPPLMEEILTQKHFLYLKITKMMKKLDGNI